MTPRTYLSAAAWVLLGALALPAAALAQGKRTAEPVGMGSQYYHQPCPETPGYVSQDPQQGGGPGNGTQPTPQQSHQDEAGVAPPVEKTRKLSRTFAAANGRPYVLNTRYGRVQINTWARKEIRTDVDITTRADSEEKAQQLQNMIEVQLLDADSQTGAISARTTFGAMPRECWSRTRLYEVNYTVWLPKGTNLRVHNAFGDISITGDLTGATELVVEYGTLRTGRLDGPKNLVRIGNGQATVAYARQASLDASYSKLRLDAGQTVDLRNNYSAIDMGNVQDLTVHSKYGDVALGTVRSLRGSSGYSKFSIDKLSGQLDMKLQYCPAFEVRNTSSNFRSINLDGGYSTILLNFPDNAGFSFDVNTQNGKLLVDKRLVKVQSEESSASSSDVQGQFGALPGRTTSNVNIKVHSGNVSFNR
ncbi:DUF4097 family beta strand repeat-containing protein [Hymenobacter sp. BT175]|uniref:DUF4097 family beta strand repeat-containing protein n=1 Tax=Hymenobacter translucens TaxID=2886507 RepID=UPI001D0ED94F|nr:DUF4097 family beta strand repeat-containing protein [Hymenobacter translucens]MCC2548382.1 DUF4097 family beta strand repeat-containing protein [Hymenobacter translucens]